MNTQRLIHIASMLIFCCLSGLISKQVNGKAVDQDSLNQFAGYKQYVKTKNRAAKYYEELSYSKGIKLYQKALKWNPENDSILLQLAYGYFHVNEIENAFDSYKKVIDEGASDVGDQHYLIYADILSGKGLHDQARMWFEYYEKKNPGNQRARDRIEGLDKTMSYYKDSMRYEIELQLYNSDSYDFSPAYYQDKIVFVSGRDAQGAGQFLQPKYQRDQTNFLNFFVLDSGYRIELFDKQLRSGYHEGPAVFYDNDTKIIFTRNKFISATESVNEANKLHLFYSAKDQKGQWSAPKALWFNDDQFSTGHPTISKDGLTLYFASDRPGGFGNTDIYMSKWRDGSWGEPVNLGSVVNSEGSEMFPFIDEKGILYYASDGLQGIGGLDIFKIDLNDSDPWPQNLGYPLNSSRDDFGIILKNSDAKQTGYFSSNREGGQGLDDIYSFNAEVKREIVGLVSDARLNCPIADTFVQVVGQSGMITPLVTDDQGLFRFNYNLDDVYTVKANKEKHKSVSLVFDPLELITGDTLNLQIEKNAISIKGMVIDNTGETVRESKIELWNIDKGIKLDEVHANLRGVFEFSAKPFTKYQIFIKKDGYVDNRLEVLTSYESVKNLIIELSIKTQH